MKIGIVAEGKGDCAVLANILEGLGYEDEPHYLRPQFSLDATDMATPAYQQMAAEEFSSWTLVRQDCIEKTKFENFLNGPIAQDAIIIIQIDTAECELENYEVERPPKDKDYCTNLRNTVIDKINEWLEWQYADDIRYAVCIEEMEAWLLPLFEKKDSTLHADPKKKFEKALSNKKNKDNKFKKATDKLKQKGEYAKMNFYSKSFKKKKELEQATKHNQSLHDFVETL